MIRLPYGYVIDADQGNYILGREVEVKRIDKETGEETTVKEIRDQTFHRTIKQAGDALLRRLQRRAVHDNDYDVKAAVWALQVLTEAVNLALSEETEVQDG